MPLLTIARLTLRETVRRRLLLAVAILTALFIGLTGWGFSRLSTLRTNGQPVPHAEILTTAAVLVILVAFMFSFVLAVGAAFLAAPAVAGDVESGLVLALLPRPMRRSDFVAGKWLGLAALLSVYAAISSALELAVVDLVTGYVPPHPVQAVVFLAGQSLVLLTLALLCSTRLSPMTGGIIAVVLFGVAWIAGIAEAFGVAFNNHAITNAGTVVGLLIPTDGLWRGAIYNLEPAAVAAAAGGELGANPFGVTAPPTTAYVIWAVGWVVLVLGFAVLRFSRRDL